MTRERTRRIFVLHNPTAGRRRLRRLNKVMKLLRQAGCDVDLMQPETAAEATRRAREAAISDVPPDCIVAAGGDGTIARVAEGLVGTDVPLGVIPLGTANVLARDMGLSVKTDEIAETLLNGVDHPLSVAQTDKGSLVLLMVGAGFDGEVVSRVTPGLKRLFGKAAYALAAIPVLWRWHPPEIQVAVNGETHICNWVIASTARHYAGGYVLVPDRHFGAQDLTIVLMQHERRRDLLRQLWALDRGRLITAPGVTMLIATNVSLTGMAKVQIDGDPAGTLPLQLTVLPSAVKLRVPA